MMRKINYFVQIKKDDIDNVVNQVGDKEAVPFRVKVSTYERKIVRKG